MGIGPAVGRADRPGQAIHPIARAFDGAAPVYERARPEYPRESIEALWDRLGLGPASVVLDLAAGTGKLTRALRTYREARVIAVEPSEGMRAEFVRAVPGVPILEGTAESIPLGRRSVDAVVVGQAFHWFDATATLRELSRVLREGGGIALLWNLRDEAVPWVARFGALLQAERPDPSVPSVRDRGWVPAFGGGSGFAPLKMEEFRMVQMLTVEGLVERALSVSYIARLSPEAKLRVAEEVRTLAQQEFPGGRPIPLPYRTELHWTVREGPGSADNPPV